MDTTNIIKYAGDIALCLSMFILSSFGSMLYERVPHVKRRTGSILFRFILLFLAALPVGILLGTRAIGVGFDTSAYGVQFMQVKNMSLLDALIYYRNDSSPLFVCLLDFIGCFGDYQVALFVLAQTSMMFIIAGFERMKNDLSVPWGVFGFMLFFGLVFADQMRQMLALSFVFYFTKDLLNGSLKRFAFAVVVAFFIHSSIIICLFAIPIMMLEKRGYLKHSLLISLIIALVGSASGVIAALVKEIAQFTSYSDYFNAEKLSATASYTNTGLGFVITLMPLFIPFLFYYKKRKGVPHRDALIVISSTIVPLRLLAYYTNFASRLAYYPSVMAIVFLASALIVRKEDAQQKGGIDIFAWAVCLIPMVVYFMVTYVVIGTHGVLPYSSVLFATR